MNLAGARCGTVTVPGSLCNNICSGSSDAGYVLLLCRRRLTKPSNELFRELTNLNSSTREDQLGCSETYSNIVFNLNPTGRVKSDLLQCLSHNVVRLLFACLGSLYGSGFIDIALILKVEFVECISEAKDLVLRKLRKFPTESQVPVNYYAWASCFKIIPALRTSEA